jgi:hypothetical protein
VLLFAVDDRTVIDAAVDGNEARFINHSCGPYCEAVVRRRSVWIYALGDIEAGDELTYDHNPTGADEDGEVHAAQYPCHCCSPTCRGPLFKIHLQARREHTKVIRAF